MIRLLVVLVQSLALFAYALFMGQETVSVSAVFPEQITAGQPVKAEIRLVKGKLSGFARLQIELPEGVTVKDAEEQKANFDFSEGIAKWVWAELPEEEEVTISLTLVADASAVGSRIISGRFSYIEDNEKKVVEMPSYETTISAPAAETPAVTTHNVIETPVPADPDSVATATDPFGPVSVTRTVGPGKAINEFEISISIYKGNTQGFARYSDDLPKGVSVKEVKTDGASFSVADGKIRFVWVNVPVKEKLEISYVLTGKDAEVLILRGEYSFVENNQSRKFMLNPESIAFQKAEPAPAATKTAVSAPAPKDTVKPKALVKTERKKPAQVKQPEAPRKTAQGIEYRVQIGAFTKKRTTVAVLAKKFKVTESITSEMHEGYTKFMVGSHAEYKGARDHREVMIGTNGIKSAFVVAYNHGKRITVQEALMISNQKWFK